ncbi:MAG: hypothetical protein AAF433_17085 [Bacteroidota bacterium]
MRYFPLILLFSGCYLSLGAQLIFPGDLNNDGIANHLDLLSLAVAYGQTGPPRPDATLVWVPQETEFWDAFLPVSGVNLAFVDADGNGLIDSLDLDGIVANYDSLQTDALPAPTPYALTDTFLVEERPEIQLSFDQETAGNGTIITADLNLIIPNPDIFPPTRQPLAVALTISFDPQFINEEAISISFASDATDLMFVAAAPGLVEFGRSPPSGIIQFAAAGRAPAVLNESQLLGQFIIVVEDMILLPDDPLDIQLTEHFMINLAEEVIETNAQTGSILLTGLTPSAAYTPLYISPNPSRGEFSLVLPQVFPRNGIEVQGRYSALGVSTFDLIVYNFQGQVVTHLPDLTDSSTPIQLPQLPAGNYWLRVLAATESFSGRLLIQN